MSQEMNAVEAEVEDMKHIAKTLTSWLKEEVNNGKECFDTKSTGDVSDIIKDMKEAIKSCYEACYYKTVIEAMEDGEEPAYGEGSYGYNHRHMANGQFASAGRGRYVSGYNPGPYMNQMPYIDGYLHDPMFEERMGYSNNYSTGGNSGGSSSNRSNSGNSGSGRSGYRMNNSEDGEIYDNYRDARRHYQHSKTAEDKAKMEEHCMSYMNHTLENLRHIWKEADPSLKAKVKKDFGDEMVEMLEGGMMM